MRDDAIRFGIDAHALADRSLLVESFDLARSDAQRNQPVTRCTLEAVEVTGKRGKVLAVDGNRVRVEGVRVQKRHLKPGRSGARTGGIVEREGYVDAYVMYKSLDGAA